MPLRPRLMNKTTIGLIVLPLLLGVASGCRQPNQPDKTALPLPDVDLSTPESAARSLLMTLKAQLDAGGRRDLAAVDAAVAQLAGGIAAADRIMSSWPTGAVSAAKRSEAVNQITRTWARLISHYAVSFEFDKMRRGATRPETVLVLVPAHGKTDTAWLRIDCVEVESDWRVSRIDFLRGEPTSQPASASQP